MSKILEITPAGAAVTLAWLDTQIGLLKDRLVRLEQTRSALKEVLDEVEGLPRMAVAKRKAVKTMPHDTAKQAAVGGFPVPPGMLRAELYKLIRDKPGMMSFDLSKLVTIGAESVDQRRNRLYGALSAMCRNGEIVRVEKRYYVRGAEPGAA
jgi:hypothetical protein